jgi:hypothetical protein
MPIKTHPPPTRMYLFIYVNKFREHGATPCFLVIMPNFTEGKVKVSLVLFVIENHAMKAYWGSGGIAPRIFDLGTRWR